MTNRVEGLKTNLRQPVARSSDSARHKAEEEAETARLMTNWARWKSGAGISVATSSAFNLEARGRREATSIPLLNGEASDVDHAVDALPPDLHKVIAVHWLDEFIDRRGKTRRAQHANEQQRARACGCAPSTYWTRLKHAHERIRAVMRAKRQQAERARELYRKKNT